MISNKSARRQLRKATTSAELALFIIFNAMKVHEALATLGYLVDPLSMRPRHSIKPWLISQWNRVLDKNYEPVFELAVKILEVMPSHSTIENCLIHLANIASRIVASKALLKHDIAGRIYHTLLLKKVAKGLATFYTSIPAAHLLAKLAFETNGMNVNWDSFGEDLVIADLACGSGTLLSAAYSANLDKFMTSKLEKGDSITEDDLNLFHKTMLERRLYGFDVLEYASHLAASWLTLRTPETPIEVINVYTLPLGSMGSRDVWLGSLSIDTTHKDACIIPRAVALISESTGPERAGIASRRRKGVAMPRPTLIIMNPPFARTGNVGHSLLLGHLPSRERQPIMRELRILSQEIKRSLGGAVGKGGLAPMFVWLAHKCLAKVGRLALVLPRVSLGGFSWEPIRNLLSKDYRIDHIVISYDPEVNWAWSENTVLSEILLVCTKGKPNKAKTKISYVFKRPRSSLEAKVLASQILISDSFTDKEGFGNEQDISLAKLYTVNQNLLNQQRNWNICIGFAHLDLSRETWSIHTKGRFMGYQLPLIELANSTLQIELQRGNRRISELAIGYDVATYQRCKRTGGELLLDVLEGANVDTLNQIEVAPNRRVAFSRECRGLIERSSQFLIAGVGRFWLKTIGLVSVCSTRPVVANAMWTVKLKSIDNDISKPSKIQVLWLNSTPGLLNVLGVRQDSKGAFIQIKKEYLPSVKLLDIKKLDKGEQQKLLSLYDQLRRQRVPSLPTQLSQALKNTGFRYVLDTALLKVLVPDFNFTLLNGVYDKLSKETIITASR